MLKIVIDTNIWISALLGGNKAILVLRAWQSDSFKIVISESLIDELERVCQRPRLMKHINFEDVKTLVAQLRWRGIMVSPATIPPLCRDTKDHPVLATAIDGNATAIVSGDADLRSDNKLVQQMCGYGIEIWGIDTLLGKIAE